jgi:hypothetical protein
LNSEFFPYVCESQRIAEAIAVNGYTPGRRFSDGTVTRILAGFPTRFSMHFWCFMIPPYSSRPDQTAAAPLPRRFCANAMSLAWPPPITV